MDSRTADVLVVGAGPTGLLLAGDLAAAGVATAVLERRDQESNLSRAFAVHARTLEMLDARGLADELIATGAPVARLRAFGGAVRLDLSRLPSRFPFVLITAQYHTERLLCERAEAHGARIVRGAEVVGVHQLGREVEVSAREPDGATHRWRTSYVVGADGLHSTVRHAVGLPFPGRSVVRSVMLADVRLADPPPDVLTANAVEAGLAFLVPFGDGWHRVIAWNRHHQVADDEAVNLDEIREMTRAALGTDFGMYEARWMSRFHSDERQAPSYRAGRVFLAGDAAHVHSPAGGLGMNTGLQDAANLSWKLAAAVRGYASEALLGSYHAERYPVGRMVLRLSGGLIRLALLDNRALRAMRDRLARTALHIGPLADAATRKVSGIAIAYPAGRGAHPLAGKRAPDIRLTPAGAIAGARTAAGPRATADARAGGESPTRLYEALRAGRFVLLAPQPPEPARDWADRVVHATRASGRRGLLLVRPDAYIAWASDETDPAHRDAALRAALTRWVGPPRSGRGDPPARP